MPKMGFLSQTSQTAAMLCSLVALGNVTAGLLDPSGIPSAAVTGSLRCEPRRNTSSGRPQTHKQDLSALAVTGHRSSLGFRLMSFPSQISAIELLSAFRSIAQVVAEHEQALNQLQSEDEGQAESELESELELLLV